MSDDMSHRNPSPDAAASTTPTGKQGAGSCAALTSNLVSELEDVARYLSEHGTPDMGYDEVVERAIKALKSSAHETTPRLSESHANTIATDVVQNVCELPGYNSPDDQPEMVMCTVTELHSCVMRAVEAFNAGSPEEPSDKPFPMLVRWMSDNTLEIVTEIPEGRAFQVVACNIRLEKHRYGHSLEAGLVPAKTDLQPILSEILTYRETRKGDHLGNAIKMLRERIRADETIEPQLPPHDYTHPDWQGNGVTKFWTEASLRAYARVSGSSPEEPSESW